MKMFNLILSSFNFSVSLLDTDPLLKALNIGVGVLCFGTFLMLNKRD